MVTTGDQPDDSTRTSVSPVGKKKNTLLKYYFSLFVVVILCSAKADKLGLDLVFVTIKTFLDQSVLALILKLIWFLATQLFCQLSPAISFI